MGCIAAYPTFSRCSRSYRYVDYLIRTVLLYIEELLGAISARLEKQAAQRQWCAAQCQRVWEPPLADTGKPAALKSIFPSCPRLSEIFHFIETNYHQPITLCDVAEAVGYSPAYLSDLVRRQTRQTVKRWNDPEHFSSNPRNLKNYREVFKRRGT